MALYRSDQARIGFQVPGVNLDIVSWDTFEGGENQANNLNYMPGGMQPAVDLGGVPQRSDITITREWSDTLAGIYKPLDNLTGKGTCTVSYQTLDANGNPVPGALFTYTGVIKSVSRPNYDSASSVNGKLQVVISCNSPVI